MMSRLPVGRVLVLVLLPLLLLPSLTAAPTQPSGQAPLELVLEGFQAPTGLAVAPDGTLFFTDEQEGSLFQHDPDGILTLLEDGLQKPRGLTRAADGTLFFVAERLREQQEGPRPRGLLLQRSPDGTLTLVASGFDKPQQLRLTPDGTLLLSTREGRRQPSEEEPDKEEDEDEDEEDEARGFPGTLFRVSPTGQVLATHPGFRRPMGLLVAEDGTLTVAAEGFKRAGPPRKGSLFQIAPTGDVTVLVPTRFRRPAGLVADPLGALYVTVKGERRGREDEDDGEEDEGRPDGGQILKVAPDGTVTRFAQGFQRPWDLALDAQGNLYVSDPKDGRIYRFRAPPPPILAPLPAATNELRVTLSGTTEPATQLTVRGGAEPVRTLADAQGTFTLDVPLRPGQRNTLLVYATGARGAGLTGAPTSAAILQGATPPEDSPPPSQGVLIVLAITAPTDGDTVSAGPLLVRGTVEAGGVEVGLTVNGIPAPVQGNTFTVLVPVSPATTTLTAVATTAAGDTASQTIALTVTPAPEPAVTLAPTPSSGVAPLTVRFSLSGDPVPAAVSLDLEGDGLIDFTGPSLEGQTFTYTQPGLFLPTVTVTDAQGAQFTARAVVQVDDRTALDTLLQGKWTGMKDALRAGDIPGAVTQIVVRARPPYEAAFQVIATQLPNIDAILTDLELVEVRNGAAIYHAFRTDAGIAKVFEVRFALDGDGVWRIEAF